jgi:hypothetical protein
VIYDPLFRRFPRLLLTLACGLLAAPVFARGDCRIAFDMGSSGIRAGASNSQVVARASFDYLAPLKAGRGLDDAVPRTIAAMRDLPQQAGFATDCARVGGGFSAWRMALQQDAGKLALDLARIEAESGVAVLVIPQKVEGAYGYYGARRLLGERLRSSHVLDIGGGSMQIAGERTTFGQALGQKIWHQKLCQEIRHTIDQVCNLQPMTRRDRTKARALLTRELRGIDEALPEQVTMAAISRPVTHGVAPAVSHLLGKPVDQGNLNRRDLTAAIRVISRLTLEETAARLSLSKQYAAYLLSDMLLVEGLMTATRTPSLQIAELDLTNLPGLLADDVAFRWADYYGCYLERLRQLGLDAYASDPATCPATNRLNRLHKMEPAPE